MSDVRIKFFTVERCGYYKRYSKYVAFGSLMELLDDLSKWVDAKPICETSTYEPTDSQDQNLLHTYCYGIRQQNAGDVLLTTWNETATTDGSVASVELTGIVESADIETSEIPNGYAPGYPAYFWFPRGLDGFATIQINNRLNGRSNLDKFLLGFLRNFARWVVYEELGVPDADRILGYSETGSSDDLDSVRPHFRAAPWRNPGNLEIIRNRRMDIRKIIRRDELSFRVSEDLSLWQTLWRKLIGDDDNPQMFGTHKLALEVECTPEATELESMIRCWEESQRALIDSYQDVGFVLRGDQRVHWLSSSLASEVIDLDIRYSDGPLVDSESLLGQLTRHREQILALLLETDDGG